MADERDRRPYQQDAQGRELQLEQPELGKRAYHFIQAFRLALEDNPKLQQSYHEQKTKRERSGYPDAMVG